MYTIIFIDEDSDLITREFESLESALEFEAWFEEEYNEDEPYDNFWHFGYEPKHVIVEGKVIKNRT